jgi:hypothetical protein
VSPADHEQLDQRYWQLERQLQDLHAGKVVRGDPTTIEGQLLEAQDEIEYLLGEDYFNSRTLP